jgi:hypothetical protein
MKRLDINPGKGIGPILLGMHPQRIGSVLDEKPVYEKWMGGNLNDSILYHGLILSFDACNSAGPLPGAALCGITVHGREDAYLFGRPMGDWTRETIIDHLAAEGHLPHSLQNGDVELLDICLILGFDTDTRLTWLETG